MAKDKNERIMFWTKAPERSDNYALRSGDGPDEKDDPTTYTPGEYMSIHLRVLKTGWKFRGLLLNAVSAAPPPKAGADCIYPKTSNTKCTGGTGAYTSLASAHAACVASASCTAVYQQNCDGGTWKICTTSTFSSSASESCVYKKAGGCTAKAPVVGEWRSPPEPGYPYRVDNPSCPNSLLHAQADRKPYASHFVFKAPPAGTGKITFRALIKKGWAK